MTVHNKVSDEEMEMSLLINPLTSQDFKILVRNLTVKGSFSKDGEGDWLPTGYNVEQAVVTKFYHSTDNRLVVSALSGGAKSLLLWLMYEIASGKDYVWVNKQRYMKENGISSLNTYKDAIKQLAASLIITPTVYADVYWINPRVFFSGSRIAKYPQYVQEVGKVK